VRQKFLPGAQTDQSDLEKDRKKNVVLFGVIAIEGRESSHERSDNNAFRCFSCTPGEKRNLPREAISSEPSGKSSVREVKAFSFRLGGGTC